MGVAWEQLPSLPLALSTVGRDTPLQLPGGSCNLHLVGWYQRRPVGDELWTSMKKTSQVVLSLWGETFEPGFWIPPSTAFHRLFSLHKTPELPRLAQLSFPFQGLRLLKRHLWSVCGYRGKNMVIGEQMGDTKAG